MSGQTTVIVKRKRAASGSHRHGGAWKVAYADFVTAMMAFFLLMWLLNATTEQQRKGLADYFDPSIPIAAVSGGGSDALMGDDVLSSQALAANAPPEAPRADATLAIEDALNQAVSRSGLTDQADRLRVTTTQEGTLIELVEGERQALFAKGSAEPSQELVDLIGAVADVAIQAGRPVSITGHTDALRYTTAGYSNWELSADRANAARRLLLAAGLPEGSIVEVVGKADRAPLSGRTHDPANRRIAIMLLGAPTLAAAEGSPVRALR